MALHHPKHYHAGIIFVAIVRSVYTFDQPRIFHLCLFKTSIGRVEVESGHQHNHNRLRNSLWHTACLYFGKLEIEVQIMA